MDAFGIIAEFNPFHNGHKYLIERGRRMFPGAACAVIMSGSFVQRGEPAVMDKWTRARTALLGGADVVIELPCAFSLLSAEGFARGAVETLGAVPGIKHLLFGSEAGVIEPLNRIAEFNETDEFKAKLKVLLKSGRNYASAYGELAGNDGLPNNILGIEYIRAINKTGVDIEPVTVKRLGAAHDTCIDAPFASSTAIRAGFSKSMPQFSERIFSGYDKKVCFGDLEPYVLSLLRLGKFTPALGLEDAIFERVIANHGAPDLNSLLKAVKTKRHTLARIKRGLINSCLGNIQKFSAQYIRLLGLSEAGREFIRNEKTGLPLITKVASYTAKSEILELEIRATDLYSLMRHKPGGQDFYNSPVII